MLLVSQHKLAFEGNVSANASCVQAGAYFLKQEFLLGVQTRPLRALTSEGLFLLSRANVLLEHFVVVVEREIG